MTSPNDREAQARRAAHEAVRGYCLAATLLVGRADSEHATGCDAVTAALLAVMEQRDEARAALVEYARHARNCDGGFFGDKCGCGLDDAFEAASAAPETKGTNDE